MAALIARAPSRPIERTAWPVPLSYHSSASAAPAGIAPFSRKVIVSGDALAPTWMAGLGVGVGALVGLGAGVALGGTVGERGAGAAVGRSSRAAGASGVGALTRA